MNRRDVSTLLSPCLLYVIIAIATLWFAQKVSRNADEEFAREDKHKFEQFVQNVQSGKLAATSERLIQCEQLNQDTRGAFHQMMKATGKFYQAIGLGILVAIALHVWIVKRAMERIGGRSELHQQSH